MGWYKCVEQVYEERPSKQFLFDMRCMLALINRCTGVEYAIMLLLAAIALNSASGIVHDSEETAATATHSRMNSMDAPSDEDVLQLLNIISV